MIEIRNLTVGYGKEDILKGVSLTAERGRITTLVGENGCGKSTLLRTLTGALAPRDGEILLNGTLLSSLSDRERAQRIAYLPQTRNLPEITAERLVLHGRFPHLSYPRHYGRRDFEIARMAMERMGISELADRPLRELSGGTRQKVYIAMALAQEAPVICLDEPTASLDIGQQLRFLELLRTLADDGKTVLLVLHDLGAALSASDRIVAMKHGQTLFSGEPKAFLASDVSTSLYGIRVKTFETEDGEQYYYQTEEGAK